jgi:hypothetical protein
MASLGSMEGLDVPIVVTRALPGKSKPVRPFHLAGIRGGASHCGRGLPASLGHRAGVDPKVAADQRGHGIGVALNVYTKAAIGKRAEAAEKLENSVFAA